MKKFLKFGAMVLCIAILAVSCAKKEEAADASSSSEEKQLKVAMVMPGLITDEAFNQYTYEGMKRAESELGIKTAYREEVSQDEQLEVIRQFANSGYDIIIGQGGQFGEALKIVAGEFPEKQFVFSVATDTFGLKNLTAATVSYSHAGYIAGIMAGHATNTGKVAFITGEWYDPHRQMEAGFYKGVEEARPGSQATAITTGSWSDVTMAREASLALISDGYDILFFCLDAAYVGVLSAAEDNKDKGVKVVGAVVDAAKTNPDVTVGSVEYNWEELGYQESTGKLTDGKSHVLGMAEGGINPIINNLSDEGKKAVEDAIKALKAGTVDIAP